MLDWKEIQATAIAERRITALTDLSAVLLLAFATEFNIREVWSFDNEPVSDEQFDEIEKAIAQATHEVISAMIGMIVMHVLADNSNLVVLACDGASYARVDYPLLYDAIDPIYHIDTDNFRVPDLRERVPVGESLDMSLDDTGGEKEVTLTVDEMPSHSHTNQPHAHTESGAANSISEIGVGVPSPAAVAALTITSYETVSIDDTGGGNAHNNMQPYLVVRYSIVAG